MGATLSACTSEKVLYVPSSIDDATNYGLDYHYKARSSVTFKQIDRAVGCKATMKDDKRNEVFNKYYRDRWVQWEGYIFRKRVIDSQFSHENNGKVDFEVKFTDKKSPLDYRYGQHVKVLLLLDELGDCNTPFKGKHAVIIGLIDKK